MRETGLDSVAERLKMAEKFTLGELENAKTEEDSFDFYYNEGK